MFSDAGLDYLLALRGTPTDERYFVLKTTSWIKGYENAVAYCEKALLPYREIGGLPYREAVREMARSRGIVYLPNGFDVSCRMITESRVLGLEIITNDLVQHTSEDWFNADDATRMAFLRSRNPLFWRVVRELS